VNGTAQFYGAMWMGCFQSQANGSAAYADVDFGVAVAVMWNRFDAD